MKKHYVMPIVLCVLVLISGCNADVNKTELEDWIKTSVSSCGGKMVGEAILIREGILSNKFAGYAEIEVNRNSYFPDIVAYADGEVQFWKMQQDVCALANASALSW